MPLHQHDKAGRGWILLDDGGAHREAAGQEVEHERYTRNLEEQVGYLRGERAQEWEANREMRRLLAGLIERVPELEAASQEGPQDRPGGQERVPEGQRTRVRRVLDRRRQHRGPGGVGCSEDESQSAGQ
jgi:hypothetical protein